VDFKLQERAEPVLGRLQPKTCLWNPGRSTGNEFADNRLVPARNGVNAISVADPQKDQPPAVVSAWTVNVLASFFGTAAFCSFT
jgi:hypothetical protein